MLHNIRDSIKKNYYDPSFHGMNLEEIFKNADEKMSQATSNGQLFGIIAQAVRSLNDSQKNMKNEHEENGVLRKSADSHCTCFQLRGGPESRLARWHQPAASSA